MKRAINYGTKKRDLRFEGADSEKASQFVLKIISGHIEVAKYVEKFFMDKDIRNLFITHSTENKYEHGVFLDYLNTKLSTFLDSLGELKKLETFLILSEDFFKLHPTHIMEECELLLNQVENTKTYNKYINSDIYKYEVNFRLSHEFMKSFVWHNQSDKHVIPHTFFVNILKQFFGIWKYSERKPEIDYNIILKKFLIAAKEIVNLSNELNARERMDDELAGLGDFYSTFKRMQDREDNFLEMTLSAPDIPTELINKINDMSFYDVAKIIDPNFFSQSKLRVAQKLTKCNYCSDTIKEGFIYKKVKVGDSIYKRKCKDCI
jgi:hypothetical protein